MTLTTEIVSRGSLNILVNWLTTLLSSSSTSSPQLMRARLILQQNSILHLNWMVM